MTDSVERLFTAVVASQAHDPASSRTAKLMQDGVAKMAKKLVEEAAEVGLDAVQGNRSLVIEESADLVYNLAVLWAAMGVTPADVWGEMERRERLYGMAEKLPKSVSAKPRRTAAHPPGRAAPIRQAS